jgi:hypothetical protein
MQMGLYTGGADTRLGPRNVELSVDKSRAFIIHLLSRSKKFFLPHNGGFYYDQQTVCSAA